MIQAEEATLRHKRLAATALSFRGKSGAVEVARRSQQKAGPNAWVHGIAAKARSLALVKTERHK